MFPLAPMNGTQRLNLAIGLPLRNQPALADLLQQIYDPASPNYRQYLTVEEFTERFGPTAADYQAVIQFAERNGLRVTATHPNRVVLDVTGAVVDIEQAFHVRMQVYQHPREARTFHAPDGEPSPALAVPILHISGLDNFSLPHPNFKIRPQSLAAKLTPNVGSGPGGAYRGNDFRSAYVPGTTLTGTGQSVGLLQFDGYYAGDITTYVSQAGLPNVPLVNVAINGGVPVVGADNAEVALDIEMVISMAPGAAKIYVYEAPNPSPWVDLLSRMANDNLAKQLSCSWGGGSPDPTAEQIFQQMAAQGQSFFNAAGDSDAFTGAVAFPSDSTNITQVGGTTLTTTGPGGSYVSETVWNWGLVSGSYVGSSGGVSTFYGIPSWQLGISMSANQGSTSLRNIPDVALTGDNVHVVYNNGSSGAFGGTSCAAPLWAGFMALVNQQAALGGNAPVGFLNPAIYAIGKSDVNYPSLFHDITVGNNFSASSPARYSAVIGYDLCTGWGTPQGTNLINTLTPLVLAPQLINAGLALATESCPPANGVIDPGELVTVTLALRNTGTVNTTNLVVTLVATNGVTFPNLPQVYGTVVAGGGAVTQSFSFTAIGNCGGTITPLFQLQNGATSLGSLSQSLPLGEIVSVTSLTQNFDGVSAPNLPAGWSTVATGAQGNWVTSGTANDTAPNAAFTAGASATGVNELLSPVVSVFSASAQLSFRHNYNLQNGNSTGRDGGVLEVSIGGGAFTDILTAGGSFASGGYVRAISTSRSNPLAGRQAWTGNSGGFMTSLVNLPAAAAGQSVQFKWRCGTDNSTTSVGWYVDGIVLSDTSYVCCSGVPLAADLGVSQLVSSPALNVGGNLTFTLAITNLGPDTAAGVVVNDNLPAGITFVSATTTQGTVSQNGGVISCSLGTLTNGAVAIVTIDATALIAGVVTNLVSIVSGASDPVANNNTASASIAVNAFPTISLIPSQSTSQAVAASNISFTVSDPETAAAALTLTGDSSNPNLVPVANILFSGTGTARTVTLLPAPNVAGSTTINITVSDGQASASTSFILTVVPANSPPLLAAIPDQLIYELSPLVFTNSAVDPENQGLTFSLGSGAPSNATVDAVSGVFNWTPTEAQGPSTNNITVMVTDNGVPALSAARSFVVVVQETNSAPQLMAIANRTIHAGTTLVIQTLAIDSDIPTNTLTFSLAAGAPFSSRIDPTNGIYTWTTTDADANTTNTVTIQVTDDGTPPLSDVTSFFVNVADRPLIQSLALTNSIITVTWSAIAGQSYQLQFKDRLEDLNWTDVVGAIVSAGNSASKDAGVGGEQRFYRVAVLP